MTSTQTSAGTPAATDPKPVPPHAPPTLPWLFEPGSPDGPEPVRSAEPPGAHTVALR